MIRFETFKFNPVVDLPIDVEILDLTQAYNPDHRPESGYSIGRYNEARATGMYAGPDFDGRHIHIGIDIGAPAGTPVRAFYDGVVHLCAVNAARGDYGPTLITRHRLGEHDLFALWGHLSLESLSGLRLGSSFKSGDVIARIGEQSENGGWPPHLHFQLSLEAPIVADMPGVVSSKDRAEALRKYPDPRLVLGELY